MLSEESLELQRRLRRLQESIRRARLDAMIVFDRVNTFYLTGLKASLSYLMVTPREAVLFVDGRYREAAQATVRHCEVRLMREAGKDLARWRNAAGARKMGFEVETPWGVLQKWKEWLPECEWTPAGESIRKQRLIKSKSEIKKIAESARLNDLVLARAQQAAVPGATELDLRAAIRAEADRLGTEGESFDCIVAGGAMGARPHYRPQKNLLKSGDLLLIDLGVLYEGYCSDMTRVVGLGKPPKPKLMRAYDALLAAQEAALKAVGPGVACRDIDAIARNSLKKKKLDKYFTHGLGHGVGLEIHEAPTLNARSQETLRPGMIVTVEPGVYLPGLGGIRIEDLVVVTSNGHKVLSRSPKKFQLLPFDGTTKG